MNDAGRIATGSGNTMTSSNSLTIPITNATSNAWSLAWNSIAASTAGIGNFFYGIPQIPGMASGEAAKLQQLIIQDLYKDGIYICISGFILYNSLWLISDCTRDISMLLPHPNILDGEERRKNDDKIICPNMKFNVGDLIESRYKGGETWLPGNVSAVNSDGACYNIRFNNGYDVCAVPAANIRSISSTSFSASGKGTCPQSGSLVSWFIEPMARPYSEIYRYIKDIPRTGRERRSYIPMILLTVAITTEKTFLREHFCKIEPPPQLLRNILLPGVVAACGIWCSWKANFEAERVENSISNSDEFIEEKVTVFKHIPSFIVSRRWIARAKIAAYSVASSLLFMSSTGSALIELYNAKVYANKVSTWGAIMQWTDYILGLGPLVDAWLMVVGVPAVGIGTLTNGIRKYIKISPDGSQLAWIPPTILALKGLSSASGVICWLAVKRYQYNTKLDSQSGIN